MRLFLFPNPGTLDLKDVYGYELTDPLDAAPTVQYCSDYLMTQKDSLHGVDITIMPSAAEIIAYSKPSDLVLAVQTTVYRTVAGSGLRGYYRSTCYPNSERCKGLAITILKSMSDYTGFYYHGVYNEQRDAHLDLSSIVKVSALAAMIEIGYIAKDPKQNDSLTGMALARGILRYLNACRIGPCRQSDLILETQTETNRR